MRFSDGSWTPALSSDRDSQRSPADRHVTYGASILVREGITGREVEPALQVIPHLLERQRGVEESAGVGQSAHPAIRTKATGVRVCAHRRR